MNVKYSTGASKFFVQLRMADGAPHADLSIDLRLRAMKVQVFSVDKVCFQPPFTEISILSSELLSLSASSPCLPVASQRLYLTLDLWMFKFRLLDLSLFRSFFFFKSITTGSRWCPETPFSSPFPAYPGEKASPEFGCETCSVDAPRAGTASLFL